MKKKLLSLLALILCLPAMFLVGCKEQPDNSINMNRYFQSKVKYELYNQGSSKVETELKEFTHSLNDNQRQYSEIAFNYEGSWIYKMYVEKVSFDIYANAEQEVQFVLRMDNLSNSDIDSKSEPKFKVLAETKTNEVITVTFVINDYINKETSSTMRIITDGAQYFQGENENFVFDISNLRIYGEHRI